MIDIPKPINMTDKYFYSIAVSLRNIEGMLMNMTADQFRDESSMVLQQLEQGGVAVEDVAVEHISSVDLEDYEEDPEDLESKTVVELKKMAREMGIVGYSNMNKGELIEHLIRGE